jgi:hypothetical protein
MDCGAKGFCISSSDDWNRSETYWEGFKNEPPDAASRIGGRAGPRDMVPVCKCGSYRIELGKELGESDGTGKSLHARPSKNNPKRSASQHDVIMGLETLTAKEKREARRLPVVSLGAEHLAIGYLMRRNILAYKAPPFNEGYDLICIHPNPRTVTRQIRVQVKSRYQTDNNGACPLKEKSISAFDYLIVVFMNIGYFYSKKRRCLMDYRSLKC